MSELEQKALKTVKHYMWFSMGAGLVPFPVLDLLAVSGVELKMVADISSLYNVPFHESRVKAITAALLGSVVPAALSFGTVGSALKAVPGIGALAGAPAMVLFSGASAWALGKVFIQHFESGGTFLDFNPDEVKEYFKAQFEEGRKLATPVEADKKVKVPV